MTQTTKRTVRRAGFTMVEMLVVVTIILIILSLSTAAVLQILGSQQAVNTKTELTRLQGDLLRAYRSAADKFRKEPYPTQGSPLFGVFQASVQPMAGSDANATDRLRVIWVKLRLKQTFPNNFAEAWNPSPMPGLSYYQTKLQALGYGAINFGPSYQPQSWESSVCLLWALQRAEDSQALKESDIGTGSLKDFGQAQASAKDPTSGLTPLSLPVKGLVDNWGTPLAFCRWPIGNTLLNPGPNPPPPPGATSLAPGFGNPQPGDNNDADDPTGLLESSTWQQSTGFNTFQQVCYPLPPHPATTPTSSFRVFPLIVSAGPDRRLGLDKEPLQGPPAFAFFPNSASMEPVTYNFGLLPGAPAKPASFAIDNLYPQLASPK